MRNFKRRKLEDIIFTPKCCDKIQKSGAVHLYVDVYNTFPEDVPKPPTWRTYSGALEICDRLIDELGFEEFNSLYDVEFCPHCGTKLPEVKLKTPSPKDVCVVSDSGYYCDTCKDRLRQCECKSPEFLYEIINDI